LCLAVHPRLWRPFSLVVGQTYRPVEPPGLRSPRFRADPFDSLQVPTVTDLVYTRPYLYPRQQAAIFTDKRWTLLEASTKSGMTAAGIARILEWGFLGKPGQTYWFVTPSSEQTRVAFNRVRQNLPIRSFQSREAPTPTIIASSGTLLVFRSADSNIISEDIWGLVIDGASQTIGPQVSESAWHQLRSNLMALKAPAVIMGSVRDKNNWFYNMCRRSEAGDLPDSQYRKITYLNVMEETNILDESEIEEIKKDLPDYLFRALYLCEPLDDSIDPDNQNRDPRLMSDRELALIAQIDLGENRLYMGGPH